MTSPRKSVVFITPLVTHYRAKFHVILRDRLAAAGVKYDVICGIPHGAELLKGDTVTLPWSNLVSEFRLPYANGKVVYHPIFRRVRQYDLAIMMQENKHVLNYLLQITQPFFSSKIAFMGHGRNFQARNSQSMGERWKRYWATKVDWWFAYTNESRAHVEQLGFPAENITVFNNSVDISELRTQISNITPQRLADLKNDMGLIGRHVGVFVGGLYPDKRLEFLVEAADLIRARLRDFELLVIGGGEDLPMIQRLGATRPWMRVLGPQFGEKKVELMLLGHVFMMPGLVGLAILDAGAASLPIATTRFPWHSPEIAYLTSGESGIIVDDWQSPTAYGEAVASLLADPDRRSAMGRAAEAMSRRFSIEAMAENFAQGVLKALGEEEC